MTALPSGHPALSSPQWASFWAGLHTCGIGSDMRTHPTTGRPEEVKLASSVYSSLSAAPANQVPSQVGLLVSMMLSSLDSLPLFRVSSPPGRPTSSPSCASRTADGSAGPRGGRSARHREMRGASAFPSSKTASASRIGHKGSRPGCSWLANLAPFLLRLEAGTVGRASEDDGGTPSCRQAGAEFREAAHCVVSMHPSSSPAWSSRVSPVFPPNLSSFPAPLVASAA